MRKKPQKPFRKLKQQSDIVKCFSRSLLRDIKLKPPRGTTKSNVEEEFIRDGRIFRRRDFIHRWFVWILAVDGSMVRPRFSDDREQRRDSGEFRRPMRDTKRRQEYMQ